MSVLKGWLLGVVATALAVALAQALTPDGTVKKVGRLVGGLVLLMAVAQPLLRLDPNQLAVAAAAYSGVEGEKEFSGGEEVLKTLIAQKAGAYIVDKGQSLGLACTAEVEVAPDASGWPIPWKATVSGQWSQTQKKELSQAVEEELGIPAQRQSFREEGT